MTNDDGLSKKLWNRVIYGHIANDSTTLLHFKIVSQKLFNLANQFNFNRIKIEKVYFREIYELFIDILYFFTSISFKHNKQQVDDS